ncbi:hypothetical protein, partial [Amaricoccus solimangrovi]
MPDAIHPVEREMIDARLEAGLFTRCAAGARSGIAWDDEAVPLREQIRRDSTAGKAEAALNSRRREMRAARRDQIRRRHA